MPIASPASVPMMRPSRIDRREIVAEPTLLSSMMTASVPSARRILAMEPYSASGASLPPMAQSAATGTRVSPMAAMMVPVTTGEKSNDRGEERRNDEAGEERHDHRAQHCGQVIARTCKDRQHGCHPSKGDPLTMGSLAPMKGTPTLCSSVASPPTNRLAVTSSGRCPGGSPAALPMISGTAMIPPYMVRTC